MRTKAMIFTFVYTNKFIRRLIASMPSALNERFRVCLCVGRVRAHCSGPAATYKSVYEFCLLNENIQHGISFRVTSLIK